jgi:hypothetical protein
VSDLWAALGYDSVALSVAEALAASDDIVVLEGPPGVGKSSLTRGIGVIWESGGGATIAAQGDFLHGDAALHPFLWAMSGTAAGWKDLLPSLAGATRAGEILIGTAGLITATVELLAKAVQTTRRGKAIPLANDEQDILYEFEGLSHRRPILFIADNLHWWDAQSLALLVRLRDPRMRAAFPFLDEMRVLAVQTPPPYQQIEHPEAHEAFLTSGPNRVVSLQRVERDGFDQVLEALGAGPMENDELVDAVHALSGGHLALSARCAVRIAEGDTDALIAAADSDAFIRNLLVERVRSLGEKGKPALAMLQVAALLGLTFRRDTLSCALEDDSADVGGLLRYCRDERIVELSDNVGRFVHDLYRQHFLRVGSFDQVTIHEKLDDCLRSLRSGEYELRCLNALKAERSAMAAVLGVQAALQKQREGLNWRELPSVVIDAVDGADLIPIVETFERSLERLDQTQFEECLATLATLRHGLDKRLRAEADYLRAKCLMTTRSMRDCKEGVALLEPWSDYVQEEPELGVRLMQQLLFGLSLESDKTPGRALETRIKQALSESVSFDTASEDAMYTLDRCSESLYEPDVGLIKIAEATRHFRPQAGQSLARRPMEYYRSLVNYGASLLTNAKYEEASDVYIEVNQLVESYPRGTFPRLDYPMTNELLVKYRLGEVSAEDAVRRQREVIDEHLVAGDPFYAENALAVYLALTGSHGDAEEVYERLDARLSIRKEPEVSMLYLIRANRCSVRFVGGSDATAVAHEWSNLDPVVRAIPYVKGRYLIPRHEMLGAVIEEQRKMSAQEFDECLILAGPNEFGRMWNQLGRGFRMPEIHWWH